MVKRPRNYAQRPALSTAPSTIAWLRQFDPKDQKAAGEFADEILLLNDDDVARAIRSQLASIEKQRSGARKKIALYAEREFAEKAVFKSSKVLDRDGILRSRAVGNKGPAAVDPVRGRTRVGSEGAIAFLISQAVSRWPKTYLNQPGPDRIRRHKAGLIAIVTDFIGSGDRVCGLLDKFMAVPSVRAWRSNRWIDFAVVSAAATSEGVSRILAHKTNPNVYVTYIALTLQGFPDREKATEWLDLTKSYGPRLARGSGPAGFKDTGSLIAFSYRVPNNTPLLLHEPAPDYIPLFQGFPSEDMHAAFGMKSLSQRISSLLSTSNVQIADDLLEKEEQLIAIFSTLKGRWHIGQEVSLAEATGMTVPEIIHARETAETGGLLDRNGRLTDFGHLLIRAGETTERKRFVVPTRSEPYYPLALRVPK